LIQEGKLGDDDVEGESDSSMDGNEIEEKKNNDGSHKQNSSDESEDDDESSIDMDENSNDNLY
jgi:hypothetical protein